MGDKFRGCQMPSKGKVNNPIGAGFKPNKKGESRRGGRQAGTSNKTTTTLKEDLLTAAEELGFPKAMPILDAGRDDRGRGIGLGKSDTKHAWRCPRFRRSSRQ